MFPGNHQVDLKESLFQSDLCIHMRKSGGILFIFIAISIKYLAQSHFPEISSFILLLGKHKKKFKYCSFLK